MFDFENLSTEELSLILKSGINPLTGCRIQSKDSESIIQMIYLIHAAIHDYEIDIEGHFVFIPGLDGIVEIEEWTTISPLAKKISNAFYEATNIHCEQLSKQNIQNAILQYLLKNGYLELLDSPYSSRDKSYYATEKGQDCGILNTHGKNGKHKHLVSYSCHMQACIVRKLPEILSYAAILKYEADHDIIAIENSIEPLNLEEQELISQFRILDDTCKKRIKQTISNLINAQFSKKTESKQDKNA